MQILGIDFTSAPSARKPLLCASGWLEEGRLVIQRLDRWQDYAGFENALAQPGPWTAGLDFPFAFPRAFCDYHRIPIGWGAQVEALERFHSRAQSSDHSRERELFRRWIAAFRDDQPRGQKHPLRLTDRLAGAVSPLMVFGVPVGMMLLEGAPRLWRAGLAVPPLRPMDAPRLALETYPALAVRNLLGEKVRYKTERRKPDAQRAANRARLLEAAAGRPALESYGVRLELEPALQEACRQDQSGDSLDALLCALQAAWACSQRKANWGVPPDLPADVRAGEGWIVDPFTRAAWRAQQSGTPGAAA